MSRCDRITSRAGGYSTRRRTGRDLGARMDAAAKDNNAAKAADRGTALFDAVGQSFDLPAAVRSAASCVNRIPCGLDDWPRGDLRKESQEAEAKSFRPHLHNNSKSRSVPSRQDDGLVQPRRLAVAPGGRASHESWTQNQHGRATAVRCCPPYPDLGVESVERPVPAWKSDGMARLRSRATVR